MRFKDELAGADPILFGLEFGGIEEDFGLALEEGFAVASRFAAWSVNGVGAVDGADFEGVIVLGGHVAGRAVAGS